MPETNVPENNAVNVEGPKFELTTKQDGPNGSIDRFVLGNIILEAINWDEAEERESKRDGSKYLTTSQFSWYMAGPDGRSYQVGLSVNSFPQRVARGAGAKAGPVETEVFKLSNNDVIMLDQAITKMMAEGNVNAAVQYATIKKVHQRDGRVSRADFLLVASEIPQVVGKQ